MPPESLPRRPLLPICWRANEFRLHRTPPHDAGRDRLGRPLQAGAHYHHPSDRPHCRFFRAGGAEHVCQQLPGPGGPSRPDHCRSCRPGPLGLRPWLPVRFICGTQQIHKDLEAALSTFLGTDDTLLYSSCFDANEEDSSKPFLGAEDAVISDEPEPCFHHRWRSHSGVPSVTVTGTTTLPTSRTKLIGGGRGASHRFKLIATDGVFSDGRHHRQPEGNL